MFLLFLGGDIVSTFDGPVKLGKCDLIEEIMIGEDKLIKFSGKIVLHVLHSWVKWFLFLGETVHILKYNYSFHISR